MPRNKHWIPLTYTPKIPGVQAGTIRQTIRIKQKTEYRLEDLIAFHGWSGRPYFDPWSFRTEYFALTEVIEIEIRPSGILMPDGFWPWVSLSWLAIKDGINPGTGLELGRVLKSYHKIPDAGVKAYILRW